MQDLQRGSQAQAVPADRPALVRPIHTLNWTIQGPVHTVSFFQSLIHSSRVV